MDTECCVELRVILEPVGQPWVAIDANGWGKVQQLTETTEFDLKFYAPPGVCNLSIEHFKKDNNDPTTAVIIKKISFFGIEDPRFIWAGVYKPDYPPHYPNKVLELSNTTYLGWNGVWSLDFGVPVFTWIHQVQNLGWIYQ